MGDDGELGSSGRGSDSTPRRAPMLVLDLDTNPEAPSVARAAVAGLASDIDIDEGAIAMLKLLVSEIVTNAVIHPVVPAAAKINLRAEVTGETLRVEVTDGGDGFVPQPRDPRRRDGGYGLFLLDKSADRWGVEQGSGNKVWFELTT